MTVVSLRPYCNQLEEIPVFAARETALAWLDDKELSNDGLSLLVPFSNVHGKIRFLKPLNKDTSLSLNEKLRIIGMANHERVRTIWEKLADKFDKYRVPHIEDIEGDSIIPDEPNGFLIVYKKGQHKVGRFYCEVFTKLQAALASQIEKSPKNGANLQINAGQLMESLSILAANLFEDEEAREFDIASGRMYFILEGRLFRYTFRKDPANTMEEAYLAAEAELKQPPKKTEAYTEKNINNHRWSAFKGYWKVFALGLVTETVLLAPLLPLLIALHFFPASIPLMAAVVVVGVLGVVITTWTMKTGFKQVAEENKATIDYGKTTFREFGDHSSSVFAEIKQGFQIFPQIARSFVFGKKNPEDVPAINKRNALNSTPIKPEAVDLRFNNSLVAAIIDSSDSPPPPQYSIFTSGKSSVSKADSNQAQASLSLLRP